MKARRAHLEDVARAARQGLAVAFTVSMLALATMLIAGTPLPLALPAALVLLALGSASGGFGLVARVSWPPTR